MLAEMRIQSLGVIADATLELHSGLTVVTGETGAGKTMVVTGLHLLSGGRAEASRVRTGADRTTVEGRFQLRERQPAGSGRRGAKKPPVDLGPSARAVAEQAGAEVDEDGSLIAIRTVGADGRSRAHLGGRTVPVGVLAELTEQLIAVHGQNDQLRLLRPGEQRAVLDRFAGESVAGPLAEYRRIRTEWLSVARELTERTERARELAREAEMLRHGLTEISAVAPLPGEDEDLVQRAKRLADVDQLRETAAGAALAISGAVDSDADQSGALGLVGEARRRVSTADDSALRELESRLVDAAALLSDVGTELASYLDQLDADPAELERVLARQVELKQLTRKYAVDIDGVLAWAADAEQRLSTLDTSDAALGALAKQRDALAVQLAEHAATLTERRSTAAGQLAKSITEELAGLAMAQAKVEVTVRQRPAPEGDEATLKVGKELLQAGPDGVDDVELLLVAHPGAPALAVNKGASGGELSRVMLAIEVVLAHTDPVPTLVFDEVDAGVGGRAAVEIGRRLAKLARSHQVVVVTHLPQVAAYADRHLVVDKNIGAEGLTRSGVKVLNHNQRVVELARMLAGLETTESGRAHAEELLATAEAYTQKLRP